MREKRSKARVSHLLAENCVHAWGMVLTLQRNLDIIKQVPCICLYNWAFSSSLFMLLSQLTLTWQLAGRAQTSSLQPGEVSLFHPWKHHLIQTKGKRDKECSKEAQSPHWHEASRGKLFSSSPSPVFAGVSEPFYIQRLKEIPTPSKFGKEWEKYQDSDDPLFGCLRPGTARGIPPALMHPAFGEFLDLVKDMALDSETCDSVMRMIDTMSSFYRGRSSAGEARGREAERARIFRQELLKLMATLMQKKPATLEPSSVSMESESATDGSYAIYDSENKKSLE